MAPFKQCSVIRLTQPPPFLLAIPAALQQSAVLALAQHPVFQQLLAQVCSSPDILANSIDPATPFV